MSDYAEKPGREGRLMKMQMMYTNPQAAEKAGAYVGHETEHTFAGGGVNLDYFFPSILVFSGNLSGSRLKTIPNQKQKNRSKVIVAHSGAEPSCGTVVVFCAQKQGKVHRNCRAAQSG